MIGMLAGQPSGKELNFGHCMKTFQPCLYAPFTSISYISFRALTLTWGHKVSVIPKPVGFIYSHTIQLNRMKVNVVVKQIKEHPDTTFLQGLWNQGKSIQRWHAFRYEWILCKVGMMIDTNRLHILILVNVTLTYIQGRRVVR